jgi:hypothetical protein
LQLPILLPLTTNDNMLLLHACAAPAGLQSIVLLTQLTALHLIQGRGGWAGWPLPAAAISCLSSLTGLQHFRSDTGGGYFACFGDVASGVQQAEAWAVALSGMQQLTRLELSRAVMCDPLLCAVGSTGLPQLQVLVLEAMDLGFEVSTSAEGADAIARIPHLELTFHKGFDCMKQELLLRLPSLRRLCNGAKYCLDELSVLQGWSEDNRNCTYCGGFRR